MLKFLSVEDGYDHYLDEDDDDVFLAHGTFKRLVPFDTLDLDVEWSNFASYDMDAFLAHLCSKVIDEYLVDEVTKCNDCDTIESTANDMHNVNGDMICDSCIDAYFCCPICDRYRDSESSVWIESRDESICESCCDMHYTFCDDCDDYTDNDAPCGCNDGCSCESPVQSFSIRNDGQDPLANDVPLAVSLPAGTLSGEGVNQIISLLQRTAYAERDKAFGAPQTWYDYSNPAHREAQDEYRKAYDFACSGVRTLDAKWQTKEGNFTKRLSRLAYKTYGIKIAPAILSEIGNIGNQHSQGVDFEVEITRDLNQSPEAFGHSDSCYWQSYYSSRCTLKSNGAFGLRAFGKNRRLSYDGGVTGRAWVQPLKLVDGSLEPTFNTETPDAFVVFNGYGDLGGYAPARIMAHLAGMTYRKIEFVFGEAYINAGGYLIGSEEIVTDRDSLYINVDPHNNVYGREQAANTQEVAVA